MRSKRPIEVESVFGNIKGNYGVRRFLLRGLEKVAIEWGLYSIAKNELLARITLPEDNTNILTSKYQLYLPSESDLLAEVKEVISLAGEKNGE